MKPFEIAADRSMHNAFFKFLARYLAKDQKRYRDLLEWKGLFLKYYRHGPMLDCRQRWQGAGAQDKLRYSEMMCLYGSCSWKAEVRRMPRDRPLNAEEKKVVESCCPRESVLVDLEGR